MRTKWRACARLPIASALRSIPRVARAKPTTKSRPMTQNESLPPSDASGRGVDPRVRDSVETRQARLTRLGLLESCFALALERVEQGWTKGAAARDQFERSLPESHASATCWCLTGALSWAARVGCERMSVEWQSALYTELCETLRAMLDPTWKNALSPADANLLACEHTSAGRVLVFWNDRPERTVRDVRALLFRAMRQAERAT